MDQSWFPTIAELEAYDRVRNIDNIDRRRFLREFPPSEQPARARQLRDLVSHIIESTLASHALGELDPTSVIAELD